MRIFTKISLLLVLAAFLASSVAYADVDKDDDKDKDKKSQRSATVDRSASKYAAVGNCNLGSASKDLDGNNIRARLFNNGALFWKGSGNVYTVPIGGEANSIFASGIWIAGRDDAGEIRFAGTAYGPFEYWPGPLDANGNPPADCSVYDRIFKVTRADMDNLNQNGVRTADIIDWPFQLGAPVVDGDGNPNNYNLDGGDRPELIGEQTAWWVMNDVGNVKGWSQTAPIGLEVQVTAFAFRTSDALNNTTFYKYKLIHKGDQALNDTYFGIWSDPDLGNAADDFVGSDTTLGLGIVYNGTDNDQGFDGYGTTPPALAYDFFQGPLVPAPGETHVDPDGTVYQDSKRLKMTKFVYYNNDSTVQGNPSGTTDDPYNYLQGIWRDGTQMTFGGTGYGGSTVTNFMFPGDPSQKAYWSEENTDGRGSRNTPADRRFLLSTGPFTLKPGDTQDIVYGIVWSRSVNRLASVAQLRFDDILAQGAFNSNFNIPRAPDGPDVTVSELDQTVILEWANKPTSNNFLDKYDAPSAFLVDPNPPDGNTTYTFEGYRVWQYESEFDQVGRVIATFDRVNNVTTVVDEALDLASGAVVTKVVAQGSDSGVQSFIELGNLTNYQDYHFGVQAYAYNPNSAPKIYASPIERVTVTPRKPDSRNGGTVLSAEVKAEIESVRTAGVGDKGGVYAKVTSPLSVKGDTYTFSIYDAVPLIGRDYQIPDPEHAGEFITVRGIEIDGEVLQELLTYDLTNSSGTKIINGAQFIQENGKNVPFGVDVVTIDGLSFSIGTAPADFKNFLVVANANGPLDPFEMGAFAFNSSGFPTYLGNDRPSEAQQVGPAEWGIHTGDNGSRSSYEAFLARSIRNGFGPIVPFDFEIRFTEKCVNSMATGAPGCYGYDRFDINGDGDDEPVPVPFELWNIGAGTENDPSDDFRLVPAVIDWEGDGWDLQDFDHSISGGNNDPESDWIYWYNPNDRSPGTAGYDAWEADLLAGTHDNHGGEIMARIVLVNWNGGTISPGATYNQALPEVGTIFRMTTTKPLVAGDKFTIDASAFKPVTADAATAQKNIDQIGIVPNPYKGASAYEINLSADQVRFTNLPDNATIRVFNLAGTLIRTLNLSTFNNKWDLTTEDGLPIASGMYLVHVDVPGVGEKVMKFGVIKKRIQLDLF